jgi:hypothetical protein
MAARADLIINRAATEGVPVRSRIGGRIGWYSPSVRK